MNIKSKILFLVGLMIAITVSVMISIINIKTEKLNKDLVFKVAEHTAHRYAKEIESVLNQAMEDASIMEIAFWEMKLKKVNRRVLDTILIKTTRHDSKILGTWMLWEENAYDGKDREFINTKGHDSTGRVNSYWHWEGDKIINEPNQGWETSSWYNVPRKRKKETLLDPYIYKVSGKDMLLISAIQPIMHNDKFHGVVGVDIKLDSLQEMIKKLRVLETGYSSLIANNGIYVAHPNSKLIGKNISDTHEHPYKDIKIGKAFEKLIPLDSFTKEESYHISIPINIGQTDTPWAFIVSIPSSKIIEPVNSISNSILLIGALAGIVMIIMLMILVKQLMLPIDNMTNKLYKVVNKNNEQIPQIKNFREDEVGLLAKAFNIMANNLNQSRSELVLYKENLEELVDKRTIELEKSIDDLKQTQTKLIESEKMASLGGLVAGVAHEINTPIGIGLTGITHFLDITEDIRKKYISNDISQKEFEQYIETSEELAIRINLNLNRTAQLIKSFKQVAVDQTNENKRVFNLKEYFQDIIFSLDNLLKKTKIKITIEAKEDININSYPGAYSQIITNLIINSIRHAFKENEKGKIIINIEKINNKLQITYIDNGKGIPKENLSKIYEPFFTTNRKDGGTGLGLNVIYNIVTSNLKGTIECKSKIGEGVVFKLLMPLE